LAISAWGTCTAARGVAGRFLVGDDGAADTLLVLVDTDEGPAVLPAHGLEVADAAVGQVFLEVEEPTVLLVEFGTFQGRVVLGPVKDDPAVAQKGARVGGHWADVQAVLYPGPGAGVGESQIGRTVVVPEGAGIDDALPLLQKPGLGPFARGITGGDGVDAFVGHWEKDHEQAVPTADRGSPNGAPRVDLIVPVAGDSLEGVAMIVQLTRSVDRRTGRPGTKLKVEATMKYSAPTLMTSGSE